MSEYLFSMRTPQHEKYKIYNYGVREQNIDSQLQKTEALHPIVFI